MYNSVDAYMKMVDKEQNPLVLLDSVAWQTHKTIDYTGIQKQHNALCFEYKNATSCEEANVWYAAIWYWWYSSKVVIESVIHKHNN